MIEKKREKINNLETISLPKTLDVIYDECDTDIINAIIIIILKENQTE